MAGRRKISIEEAFKVLEDAGIQIQSKPVSVPVDTSTTMSAEAKQRKGGKPSNLTHSSTGHVRVALYCKHTVGSGGVTTVDTLGNKHVVNDGIVSYGPGVFYVPPELAQHLLHQDALARAMDERTFDGKLRSFIIIPKVGANGQRVNVGIQVDNEMFADGLAGNIPGLVHGM